VLDSATTGALIGIGTAVTAGVGIVAWAFVRSLTAIGWACIVALTGLILWQL
jgi:hypothetical protein